MADTPYTFRCDTRALYQLCAKRHAAMKNIRQPFESLWADIRDHFEPKIGMALDDTAPSARADRRGDEKIKNSHPRALLHRTAAGLQSGITNQAQKWLSLITLDQNAAQRSSAKQWLSTATDIMLEAMARGNLYTTLDEVYLHAPAFGQSVFVTVPGDEPGDVHHELSDEGDYWIGENRRGRVNKLIRRIWMTPSKMIEIFGRGWIDDNLRRMAESAAAETEYEVFNLITPNEEIPEFSDIPRARKYVSVYWCAASQANNGILAVRGFDYNPIIAPRMKKAGSVYGFGWGEIGLGDSKQLQTLESDKMQMVAQEATPTLAAPASLRGNTILDNYPGGIVWDKDDAQTGQRVRRLIDPGQGLPHAVSSIAETEKRLDIIFFADLFSALLNITQSQPHTMTAREVTEISAEKVALLGPVLSRFNTDMLGPLVQAYFYILWSAGAFPPPPPELLSGVPLGVRYSSALHVEQISTTKMKGLIQVLDIVGMVAQLKPEALDKLDGDQTIDDVMSVLPDSAAVILDDDKVALIRQQRAEQQAAAQRAQFAAQLAPTLGSNLKDMSEAKTGNGSALDAAITAQKQLLTGRAQ